MQASDSPAIARLLANGYQVFVVSPDPVKIVSRGSRQSLAIRAATMERAALLWHIQEMGAKVLIGLCRDYDPITYFMDYKLERK